MCTRYSFFHRASTNENIFGADLSAHGRTRKQFPYLDGIAKDDLLEIDWAEGSGPESLQVSLGTPTTQGIARRQILARFPDTAALTAFLETQVDYVSSFTPEYQKIAESSWPGMKGKLKVNVAGLTGKALFDAISSNIANMSSNEINGYLSRLDDDVLYQALTTWPVPLNIMEAHAYRLKGKQAQSMANVLVSAGYRTYAISAMTPQQVYEAMSGTWTRVTNDDRSFALSRLDGTTLEAACTNFTGVPVAVRQEAARRLPVDRQKVVLSAIG